MPPTSLEREDRKQIQSFRRAKKKLPALRRKYAALERQLQLSTSQPQPYALLEDLRALRRHIHALENDDEQMRYLCDVGALLELHWREDDKQRDARARQWEEELMGQSLSIHERQQRAHTLWERWVTVRLADASGHWRDTYRVHVNTTLPQLSLMVHELRDASPQTYNFWIAKPSSRDPFCRRSVAEWLQLLESKPDEYAEMLPVQTSLGEALFYDARISNVDAFDAYLDGLRVPFLCLLMAPRTSSEWHIPQRLGADLRRVDHYVSCDGNVHTDAFSKKGALYQKYMEMVGKRERRLLAGAEATCPECQVPLVRVHAEACLVCPQCAHSESFLENSWRTVPFGTEINTSRSTYQRINHFNEWLTRLQAKERTVVPDDVVNVVARECRKRRMLKSQVTWKRVRKFLSSLKGPYSKYYEFAAQIAYRISDVPPLYMTNEQEERLRVRFRKAQVPFDEMPRSIKGKYRKNFFSYSFFLRKACELEGYDEFLPLLPLLKSPGKINHHNRMWQFMCERLGWQYIATGLEDDSPR